MTVDLNADLGEGFGPWPMGDDDAVLAIVTSANVACGFHAGDPSVMRRTCRAAATKQVTIGAHVAYRDLANFGRSFIDVAPKKLADDIVYQLAAISGIAATEGGSVRYVKPHGALYNAIVHHEAQARAVVDAVRDFDDSLAVLGLPGSVVLRLAEAAGLRPVREAFADRAYTPTGELVPRSQPGAVLHDPEAVAARVVELVTTGTVEAVDGSRVRVAAESVCVHGDSPGAVAMATSVRAALARAGVGLEAFA